jgi:Tol biopolymer transport system component
MTMIRLHSRIALCIFIAWMAGCSSLHKTADYQIAYVSSQIKQPGIFVMNPDATGKKLLVPDPSAQLLSTSWSPDGNKIAFFSARQSDSDILSKYQILDHHPLHEIDVASGREKRLLNIPVSSFRWSPDSKYILYVSAYEDPEHTKAAIYILNLQTGEQRRVTAFGQACFGAWSPDGKQIAFSMGTDQSSDVFIMDADGQNTRCLTDSKSIYTRPAWSPDGKSIAYASIALPGSQTTAAGIYTINPDGANIKRVSSVMAYSAIWSPDGKALLMQWDGGASLTDLDGEKAINIAPDTGYAVDAVFTPDGKKLLFRSKHKEDWHIHSMDLNGTRVRSIQELPIRTFCLSPLRTK